MQPTSGNFLPLNGTWRDCGKSADTPIKIGKYTLSCHRIQLRGPWEVTFPYEGVLRSQRQTMPCDWQTLFGQQSGTARFERAFHRPTNLEPTTRVELVLEGLRGDGEIRMNGEIVDEFRLTTPLPLRLDITSRLKLRNTVCFDIAFNPANDSQPGGLYGVVALDIRE